MRSICHVLLAVVVCLPAFGKDNFQKAGPVHLDDNGEKWAEKTLHKLSVEDKVGQLFMIWVRAQFLNLNSPEYLQLVDSIHKYRVGSFAMTVRAEGPFLYRNEPYEAAMLLNQLQKESKLPLMVAADFERGVSMRLNGATVFPHSMAFGAAGKLDYAEAFGRITAQEARAIGVQWNFFPVADVNSNPANPIINTRAFGGDPQQVSDLVSAYIRGARANGMLTTAKHFPGHGDTATDSHLGVAKVTGDRGRLDSLELPPFRKAIESGVDSVMVAHVSVPALEPDVNRVATTSPAIVTDLLKQQMGFKGLVVTDALDMGALTRLYANNIGRAAVDAFKAGNDVLIIPPDIDAAYRAMLDAVHSGEISQARLDESVLKILKAKASVGLNKARLVDVNALATEVGKPENVALGQQVSDDAITLVRDSGTVLPLKQSGTVLLGLPYQKVTEVSKRLLVVIFTDDVRTDAGRVLERQIRARVPEVNVIYVDPRIGAAVHDGVLQAVNQAQSVVAAIYVVPVAGKVVAASAELKNSVSLPDASGVLFRDMLQAAARKTAVVAVGNPYVASEFPEIQTYICAYSNATVSEISAAKALFGEIAVHGRLPVTIPNVAQRGDGMERHAAGGVQHGQSQTE